MGAALGFYTPFYAAVYIPYFSTDCKMFIDEVMFVLSVNNKGVTHLKKRFAVGAKDTKSTDRQKIIIIMITMIIIYLFT